MVIYKPQDKPIYYHLEHANTTLISTEQLQPWDLQMAIFS